MRGAIISWKLYLIILMLSLQPTGSIAWGADFSDGTASLSGHFSDQALYTTADFMLPLFESPNNAVFFVNPGAGVNFALKDGTHLAERVYFGLGHRIFLPGSQFDQSAGGLFQKGILLGFNWYLDGQYSLYHNAMFDTGGGLEILSDFLDARLNIYFRLTDERSINKNIGGRDLYNAMTHTHDTGAYETALSGADAEVGLRLPVPEQMGALWVFGGGYSLQGKHIASVSGVKARVQWNPLPSIHLGAGFFSNERLNGEHWQMQFAYRIPISVNAMSAGNGLFHIDNTPKTGNLWKDRFTSPVFRHGM